MKGRAIVRAAAAALLLAVGAAGARAAAEPGDAMLRRVGERFAAMRTLSARFRQEVPLPNVGIVRTARGTVTFERPLRMRWDYAGSEPQLFLADGTHFYFRPPGAAKVFRRRIDEKALGGKIPLLLLFGGGDISAMFRVEETVARKGGEETGLRLVPRGGGAPDVRRVDLVVGTADLLPREIHLYDKLGGANHLYLEDVRPGVPVPAGFFRFRMPPGTQVVDE